MQKVQHAIFVLLVGLLLFISLALAIWGMQLFS